jgi:hypothetical protein
VVNRAVHHWLEVLHQLWHATHETTVYATTTYYYYYYYQVLVLVPTVAERVHRVQRQRVERVVLVLDFSNQLRYSKIVLKNSKKLKNSETALGPLVPHFSPDSLHKYLVHDTSGQPLRRSPSDVHPKHPYR